MHTNAEVIFHENLSVFASKISFTIQAILLLYFYLYPSSAFVNESSLASIMLSALRVECAECVRINRSIFNAFYNKHITSESQAGASPGQRTHLAV